MAATSDSVAVLGIGTMGHGIAANVLRAGIPTIVWNRSPGTTGDLEDLGAAVSPTAADAASRASIVVTMVTDADAILSIAGDQGVLAALRPSAIWAQMSTIGVAGTRTPRRARRGERPDVTIALMHPWREAGARRSWRAEPSSRPARTRSPRSLCDTAVRMRSVSATICRLDRGAAHVESKAA
jgi:threonine dehydrogenase-like Zn-dependent dehydrogenase